MSLEEGAISTPVSDPTVGSWSPVSLHIGHRAGPGFRYCLPLMNCNDGDCNGIGRKPPCEIAGCFMFSCFIVADMTKAAPIKTAKRTMEVIEEIGQADGVSISEVADALDMPKSTAYDYLQTLVELEYLDHDDDGYRVGTKFLGIGARRRLQMDIYRTAKPELKRLANETGEHATLMIEEHGMGVLLETVMGSNAVEVVAHDGTRTYLHTTAPGKAILAHMSEERVNSLLDKYEDDGLPAFASQTITDRSELFDELATIRDREYAIDKNEALDGMRGIGVPVIRRDDDCVIGAVSVYAPLNRTTSDEFEENVVDLLLQTTNVIELNLTYS